MSLSYRELQLQECWRTEKNIIFYHLTQKIPFLYESRVYLISQLFLLSPSVAGPATLLYKEKQNAIWWQRTFFPAGNGVTFSLSAVTLLM